MQGEGLGKTPSSSLLCLNCSNQLTGQQKKFCCERCKQSWRYKTKGAVRPKDVYRKHKKATCEMCGFVPIHACQLDVDHIDGNRHNHELSNLQTLCANCHRIKTHISNDYKK